MRRSQMWVHVVAHVLYVVILQERELRWAFPQASPDIEVTFLRESHAVASRRPARFHPTSITITTCHVNTALRA